MTCWPNYPKPRGHFRNLEILLFVGILSAHRIPVYGDRRISVTLEH